MVNIRKILLILLLFLVVFGVSEFARANEVNISLSASEESISQGSSGYIDVSIGGDVDVSMLSFAIFYDDVYLDVGYVKDDSLIDGLVVDYQEDGVIDVFYEGDPVDSEGVLLRVFFNVEIDAPVGLLPVEIVFEEAKNTVGEEIVMDTFNGTITVEAREILIEEITFYSRVRTIEGEEHHLVFEVYAEDYQDLMSFEGIVTYDAETFSLVEASFADGLVSSLAYGDIDDEEGQVSFAYAGNKVVDDGDLLLSVVLDVVKMDAFVSSISFEATKLINQDLRTIDSVMTLKELSIDEGVIVEDNPDLYVTNYGGSKNQSFDVYIKIEEGSNLASGEFMLVYDTDILEVVRVEVGQHVGLNGGALFFEDDVYDGDIHFSYVHESGLEEDGTLLKVTFQALEDTIVDHTEVLIEGVRAIDGNHAEIDLDYINGDIDFYTAFLIEFLDYDGTVLSSEIYEEDSEIVAPDVSLRDHTVFKEWSEVFDVATRNQTIQAVYSLVEEEIVMDDKVVVYNGQMHSLKVEGLPSGADVLYELNEFRDVGLYPVQADVYLDDVFQFTLEGTIEITPKPITVTVGSHERVYDSVGSIAYTVNGQIAGDDLDIEVFTNDGYDVGVHALTAVVHNENYLATVVDGTLEITKATYDMSMISFMPVSYTKGGNVYYVYISGTLPEGVSVTYINNGKTEVGTYTVTAEFYGDYQNYEEIDSMSTTLSINTPTILGPTFVDKNVVYDDTLHTIEVMNIPSGASVVYNVANTYEDAGSYTVEATISKAGYDDMVLVATLTITKASYDMSDVVFSDASFAFDGDIYGLAIEGTYASDIVVTYENNHHALVGEYTVFVHFDSDDENYLPIESMSATLTILDNPYVDIVFDDQRVTYNGEEHSLVLVNVPEGADVQFSTSNAYVDAGEYSVTASITMDGYDTYEMTAVLRIDQEVLVIRANDQTSIYGEDLLALSYTVEGTIYNEEVSIDIDKEYGTDAGTYAITLNASDENYDITLYHATYTIEKASYDMSGIFFTHERIIYDGDVYEMAITGDLPSGVDVEYLNNGQSAVGIYIVTASFTIDDPNYYQIPSMQARLVIEAAEIEGLTFEDVEVIYDGILHSITVDNLPDGATVVYSPSNSFIKSGEYMVRATVSLEGHKDAVLEATMTIVGEDVDTSLLLFGDESSVFNDEEKMLFLDGVLPEGVIGVEYYNHRRTEAGNQIVLLQVYVEDGYNPVPNMVAILTVSPAPIEGINFVGGEFVYDGTEKSFVLSGDVAQYGHELDVDYDAQLSYLNAGTYTVSVRLSHPNYQTLVIEETMVINKAERVIDESEFTLLVYDNRIVIERSDLSILIHYSLDDGDFVHATTIPSLEENTRYSVRIYLEETLNYQRSNEVLFSTKTYLSASTVEAMISAIGDVRLSSRSEIIEVLEHIALLMESEQEEQSLALSQVIEEYNLLIETYEYEYKLAGDIVQNIFPIELFVGNAQLATLEDIKRRDLI